MTEQPYAPLVVRLSDSVTIIRGDCLAVLPTLSDVDAIVTDPPYGLSFMGKDWDHGVPGAHFWIEALRVAKPGAYLLAFGGTRTFHRLACAIEDAGWEIRDTIGWLYGSGFPKSLDVSKAIDKAAGAERKLRINERWAERYPNGPGGNLSGDGRSEHYSQCKRVVGNPLMTSAPATDAARQWEGWGTSLKPAWEPIIVARKPIVGTVAANVLKYGTGAINIDGCRVDTFQPGELDRLKARADTPRQDFTGGRLHSGAEYTPKIIESGMSNKGRWPANLIHDGSQEVLELFPMTKSGSIKAGRPNGTSFSIGGELGKRISKYDTQGDSGSAARFFYCAKASKADRDEGCEGIEAKKSGMSNGAQIHGEGYDKGQDIGLNRVISRHNNHPTVKPTALMRYLCRLVTPPGGTILDPFMGSGSTGKAALREGFRFIGIERDADSFAVARARLENELRQGLMPLSFKEPVK